MNTQANPKLTTAAKRRYLKAGGNECPFCGSDNIESGVKSDDYGHAEIYQYVDCHACEQRWVDVYRLVRVEEYR